MQDSKAPCFEKKMTLPMLRGHYRVVIPVSFIRTHGHRLDTVISLTGPNGFTFTVAIKAYCIPSRRRPNDVVHYLGSGWLEFVKENDIQLGDCVTFRLEGNACFRVHVSSQLQEKAVFQTSPLSEQSCRCEKEGKLGNDARNDDGTTLPLRLKGTTNQAIIIPKCELNFNPADTPGKPWRGVTRESLKNVAVVNSRSLQEKNYIKHPGLDVAVSSYSRFPQFALKLTESNLRYRGYKPALPLCFAKKHGHKIKARVELRGPYGRWKIVELKVLSSVNSSIRVQFRCGWVAFSLENGFNAGDMLLFSLVGFSKFVVQVFPEAGRLQ